MKIKDIEVGNIFLAPLAGVSDVGFRKVCKICGADLTYTEMVSAKALLFNNTATKKLLDTFVGESPCAVQIFGDDPEIMAKACASDDLEKFDIIDINFGCPAPKIVKNNEGSALLKDIKKIEEIVSACVAVTTKPITCKMRIGFYENQNVCVEVAKACERAGASAITVHGRTTFQMYSGSVDYNAIASVKKAVNIPVVGNGDIFDKDSYLKMLETGVDAVMVARGALGDPWIFSRLKGRTDKKDFALIKEHIDTLLGFGYEKEKLCIFLRKHFLWYTKDIPNSKKFKVQLSISTDLDESLLVLKQMYENI